MRSRWWWYYLAGVLAAALILAGLAWRETEQAWTTRPGTVLWQASLYYQSWLMPLLLGGVLAAAWRRALGWLPALAVTVALGLGIYARFIEPNRLVVRHTPIHTGYALKLALVSDLHYGLYGTTAQMERLVERLNQLDVDAVLVAGDWTHEPPHDLTALLAPFRASRHPVYSVPGNHDEAAPGPPLAQALRQALLANGVRPVEGDAVEVGPVLLAGLGDLSAGKARTGHLGALAADGKPLLLLVHNPDTIAVMPPLPAPFLLLAGHTHGGQVNLPWLTDWLLHKLSRYRRGLYELGPGRQLFVTSGVGMVGLPLRFRMPPTIDVLHLY